MIKKICFIIFYSLFLIHSSFGQGGTWTWISGTDTANDAGVYGIQGVPSIYNHPRALYECAEWKDKQGNFWIYGGWTPNGYSDLWKFNPATYEWTWMTGNGGTNEQPVYGTLGVASATTTPGERPGGVPTWVDTSGNLWLFGCLDVSLWKYDVGINEWTRMTGDTAYETRGHHVAKGIPSPINTPSARGETASAWTDSLNNFWLYGGQGWDDNYSYGYLDDLWKYDMSTGEWTWMTGSVIKDSPVNYGIKGVADTSNDPGARYTYTKWKDAQGNFWIMGGQSGDFSYYNDVWKYSPDSNMWTWMTGPDVVNDSGNYAATCVFDTINYPGARMEQRSSVMDNCGRFWMFGGLDQMLTSYNDLWVFEYQSLSWSRVHGTNVTGQVGNYGQLGVPSSSNIPPGRSGAVAWWGNDNRFYMFGGLHTSVWTTVYADVWMFTPDTNCIPSSCNAVAVVPPVADFQTSQASICANACINFTDLSINATAWQWLFSGALDSTSAAQNPQNICYSKPGVYNVTLIASNAGGSDTVTFSNYITVNAAPPTPVITQSHDTLVCSTNPSYTSYQWYNDSTIIRAATDTLYVIFQGGNYNVQVTNRAGCSIAVGINIVLGIQNYSNDNIIYIYPNPVGREFRIKSEGFKIEKISIYNMLGQMICQPAISNTQSEIDVSSLTSGIYFVQIASESGMWVGRFVKE